MLNSRQSDTQSYVSILIASALGYICNMQFSLITELMLPPSYLVQVGSF
jgi:hypothetical protein